MSFYLNGPRHGSGRFGKERKMRYLILLAAALTFIGCHKKALDQCKVELEEKSQTNSALISQSAKECKECPHFSENNIYQAKSKVCQYFLQSLESCKSKNKDLKYQQDLYSKALHQYRNELKECKNE